MNGRAATLGWAVCAGWLAFALSGLILPPVGGAAFGFVVGVLAAGPLRNTLPSSVAIAVLAPFGLMLPALALRHIAISLGLDVPGFSLLETTIFLLLYVAFLLTVFGVIPIDVYRFGYAPVPVAVIVLTVCLYALMTGNWFLALVAVGGQAAWVAGWSSSNWFDTMLHVALIPVALFAMMAFLF